MQNPFLKAIPVRTDGGDEGSVNRYTDFFAVIEGLRTTQDTGEVAGRVGGVERQIWCIAYADGPQTRFLRWCEEP